MSCPYCGGAVIKNNVNQVKFFCCKEHRKAWRKKYTKRGKE